MKLNTKILSQIGVVAVIVGFPLISWLYLGMGIDFRREMLKKLEPKNTIEAFNIQFDSTNIISSQNLILHTSLVCFLYKEENNIERLIPTVIDQLKERSDFKLILLHDLKDVCNYNDSHINCNKVSKFVMDDVKFENFKFPTSIKGNAIALVDTALNIRNYYNLDSIRIEEIYEDLVFILPMEAENNVAIKQ